MKIDKVFFPLFKKDWGKQSKNVKEKQFHRYYDVHIQYLINLFRSAGIVVEFKPVTEFLTHHKTKVEVIANNTRILFDFSSWNLKDDYLARHDTAYTVVDGSVAGKLVHGCGCHEIIC